ncbi:hypothetical protein BS47DRAFT_1356422 [Hydnum rufescens UP504]|uniref:Uncharacterized protein n=1 Tax=Hydnum rufescens UP504 TaxID=1448309 RepID=A0A9P6ACL0_9AGAM|nr:hypothetical protein BS47DRAFT_1356422 [Hydnum rufescens UP504]
MNGQISWALHISGDYFYESPDIENLTPNLVSLLKTGNIGKAVYDGYPSCPLLTGYGQLMHTEFVYGLQPNETLSGSRDQAVPGRHVLGRTRPHPLNMNADHIGTSPSPLRTVKD